MFQEPTEVLICFKCTIKNIHISFEIFFFAKLLNRNSITHWYPPPPRIREIQLDPSPMLLPAVRRTTPRRAANCPRQKTRVQANYFPNYFCHTSCCHGKQKSKKSILLARHGRKGRLGWSTFVLVYLS